MNDSWLWFKTRAALATANDLRDFFINFGVENSVATLDGTVSNDTQKAKAVSVVKNIDGVKRAKDLLKVIIK